jgi:hypothetical protein
MKKFSITVAVTALVAFSLGYFARGTVERIPNVSSVPEGSALREHSESPAIQAKTIVGDDRNDADVPISSISNHAVVIPNERSSSRIFYMKKRLGDGDFFLLNDIGPERAEQIIQGLIDADLYIAQKRKAMSDRHVADRTEAIAEDDLDRIILTAVEKVELDTEEETLYRQILDEYYEAYESFVRPGVQRLAVGFFSLSLPEPLDYVTRETMVQIMYEENARFVAELESESAIPGVPATTDSQGWAAEKEKFDKHLVVKRAFYNRVVDRTRAYLTASQFEQFNRFLDKDLRRFELLIELENVDQVN